MISGFPPVSRPDAKVLILGSMPGIISLQQQQYYAHPRNLFWSIMAERLNFDISLDYDARLQYLQDAGIALWDVLHQCRRQGSLDSAIETATMQPNDFAGFFRQHRQIHSIFFNGKKAEAMFRKSVLPELAESGPFLRLAALPSTSPANAGIKRDEKLRQWQKLFQQLNKKVSAS